MLNKSFVSHLLFLPLLVMPASTNYQLRGYGFGAGGVNDSISTRLVGYWQFPEGSGTNTADTSANRNSGTLTDADSGNGDGNTPPQWSSTTPDLKFSNSYSLDFDGVDDYVAISPVTVSTNLTVSAWLNRTGTTNTFAPIVEQGGTRRFRLIRYSNRFCFGSDSVTDNFYCTASLFSATNSWYHVVAQFDGSHRIFVNGTEYSVTQSAGNYSSWGTNQLNIGDRPYTAIVDSFNGLIDDVRIYNYALSTDEITSLAAGNQVGGYRLNAISGEVSANKLDGITYDLGAGLNYIQNANVSTINITNPNAPRPSYNKLLFIIGPENNPTDAKFAIQISTDNFASDIKYIQSDDTIGDTLGDEDYQTYTAWGGASGAYVIGLRPQYDYYVRVKAIHGDFTETGYGPIDSARTVGPELSFDIDVSATDSETDSPYNIDMGDLSPDTVMDSPEKIWVDLTTNADAGGRVYVTGSTDGLTSSTTAYTISSITGDLAVSAEGFGAQGASATQAAGSTFSISSTYALSDDNVGPLDTTIRSAFETAGSTTSGRGSLLIKAKSSAVTPAASDYTNTLTLVAAAMF